MRRIAFAFFALLLAAGCSAASIEAQASVPADTVWSFSVILPDSGSFDNAKISLDGSQIARIKGDSGIYFPPNSIDSTKIFSNTNPVDNRVYFLVSPLAKGEHWLALKIDDESIDEESISFFEIYDAEESDNLQSQVTSVKGSVNTLIRQFNELESKLGNALDEEDKAELKTGIAGVESSLASFEAAVEEKGSERDVKINALNGYLQELEAKTSDLNKSIGIGFFSVPGINPQMQMFFLIVVVAAAAVFLVVKFRDRISVRNGLYGKAKKPLSFSQHDEDIAEQVMSESQEGHGGKWAFGSEAHRKEEHRFSIGDLSLLVFQEFFKASVIACLRFFAEKARWQLVVPPVVTDAFAADAFPGTARVSAHAFLEVFFLLAVHSNQKKQVAGNAFKAMLGKKNKKRKWQSRP